MCRPTSAGTRRCSSAHRACGIQSTKRFPPKPRDSLVLGRLVRPSQRPDGPVSRQFFGATEPKTVNRSHEPHIRVLPVDEVPPLQAVPKPVYYRIGPEVDFDEPITVWIPVPQGLDPSIVNLYYVGK